MSEKKKICPIVTAAFATRNSNLSYHCTDTCAWYVKESGACAMVVALLPNLGKAIKETGAEAGETASQPLLHSAT